jgi:hypothetical protein
MAKAMNCKVPAGLSLRADKIIESSERCLVLARLADVEHRGPAVVEIRSWELVRVNREAFQ